MRKKSDGIERRDSPEVIEDKRRARQRIRDERNLEAEERRIKAEHERINAERAKVLSSALHMEGACGMVAVPGEKYDGYREEFAAKLEERLLILPADGIIQGEAQDDDFAEAVLETILVHADLYGDRGVLGFDDVDFNGQSGRGTPKVAEHVAQLFAISRDKPRTVPAIVGFGTDEADKLHTYLPASGHQHYDRSLDRGLAGEFHVMLALDLRGEPRTMFDKSLFGEDI